MITLRPAAPGDLDAIVAVYDAARVFMRENGNPTQWADGYPQRGLLEEDVEKRRLFVMEEAGKVHAAFAFMTGDDPTYAYIENGRWPNDMPYGTIHRIASDGAVKGVVRAALDFALTKVDQVRADTHRDNRPMQGALQKCGFVRCGIIYLENGDPRIAYQYSKEAAT